MSITINKSVLMLIMRIKTFLRENWQILTFLVLAIPISISILVNNPVVVWDEASYIGVAKHIYSGGEIGFNEIARPVVLPIIIGFFWKLGINIVVAGRIIAFIFLIMLIYLTYLTGKELFNKTIALIAAVMLFLTPIFFSYSFRILTGIPSSFFALLALYLFVKKKNPFFIGIFAGLAFLLRFPNGLVFAALMITFVIVLSKNKFAELKKVFFVLLGFLLPTLSFLIYNYIKYKPFVSESWHAIFRPFIYATGVMSNETLWMFEKGYMFFIVELVKQNAFFVFCIFGLIFFVRKRLYKNANYNLLIMILVFLFGYFMQLAHKEIRYSLIFLPYLALIASFGAYELWMFQKKNAALNNIVKLIISSVVVFSLFSLVSVDLSVYRGTFASQSNIYSDYYKFFKNVKLEGAVFSTDPLPVVFLDSKFYLGFSLDRAIHDYDLYKDDISTVFYTPRSFICQEKDLECQTKKVLFLQHLLDDKRLIFYENYASEDYYILSNDDSYASVSEDVLEAIFRKNDISKKITLSKLPYNKKLFVVFYMDDAGSVYSENGLGNLWEQDKFDRINKIFVSNNASLSWSVIPRQLSELNVESTNHLKNSLTDKFEVVQQGLNSEKNRYGKSEFQGLSYYEQFKKIIEGREIIRKTLGVKVKTFAEPFSIPDENTIQALEDLNFVSYTKSWWPITEFKSASRYYEQRVFFVDNWTSMENKQLSQLKDEFDHYYHFNDYLIIHFHHFNFAEKDFDNMDKLLKHITSQDTIIGKFEDLARWQNFLDMVEFEFGPSMISLKTPENSLSDYITIEFTKSGHYTVKKENVKSFFIKNKGTDPITVCLNLRCYYLKSTELAEVK